MGAWSILLVFLGTSGLMTLLLKFEASSLR